MTTLEDVLQAYPNLSNRGFDAPSDYPWDTDAVRHCARFFAGARIVKPKKNGLLHSSMIRPLLESWAPSQYIQPGDVVAGAVLAGVPILPEEGGAVLGVSKRWLEAKAVAGGGIEDPRDRYAFLLDANLSNFPDGLDLSDEGVQAIERAVASLRSSRFVSRMTKANPLAQKIGVVPAAFRMAVLSEPNVPFVCAGDWMRVGVAPSTLCRQ